MTHLLAMIQTMQSSMDSMNSTMQALQSAIATTESPPCSTIDSGSTAWMMASSALVLLMTPGVAFFYGGLVSDRSVVTMMMQSYVAMGVITCIWFFIGFSLTFGKDSNGVIGNPGTFIFLTGMTPGLPVTVNGYCNNGIPAFVYVFYQLTFAIITPTLMTGAFADRLRFKPYITFIVLWHVLVYCPFGHLAWGGGLYAQWGVWDFAGGTVVHITSGWSALGALAVVGKRPEAQRADTKPHNVPFVVLGAGLLWFGWFGFNGGSAIASNSVASIACINSQLCAATTLFVWVLLDWLVNGKPQLVGACIGSVAGLVVVTPMAGYIQPYMAVVAGGIGSLMCWSAIELRKRYLSLFLDDALDVWGCHGVGGLVGAILVGVLSDPPECAPGVGMTYPDYCVNGNTAFRSGTSFGKQIVAAVICIAWSAILTPILLKLLSLVMKLSPSTSEDDHVDLVEHGELAYHSPTRAYDRQQATAANGDKPQEPAGAVNL